MPMPSPRKFSTSSSATSSSRTPSPSPSNSTSCSHSSLSDESDARVRLVPSTLETADAVVIVPPPDARHFPSLPSLSSFPTIQLLSHLSTTMDESETARPLLLLGPALQHLRHPRRQIAKAQGLHPYKILKTHSVRKTTNGIEICV